MESQVEATLREIMSGAPELVTPADGDYQAYLTDAADRMLALAPDPGVPAALESATAGEAELPIAGKTALKLAHSKALLGSLDAAPEVAVVFAVYNEHNRILPPSEHEHGEDFLRRKAAQLDWLFEANPRAKWRLYVVDDGCPNGSGRAAERIIEQEGLGERAQVLHLQDAIERGEEPARGLSSTDDSRKGGAIHYGMWRAARSMSESGVVIMTDADISTHLGQVGRLVHPLATGGSIAAIASRRHRDSVVIKTGKRNTRGKLFIYIWKQMLPALGYITDTQCGFKAFRAGAVPEMITGAVEKRFAFDIELLLKCELRRAGSVTRVPVAWIDSEAESTTKDLQPYLPMLKSVAGFYRKYLPNEPVADAWADFIGGLTRERWDAMVDDIPGEIADADPTGFKAEGEASLAIIRRWARGGAPPVPNGGRIGL